MADNPFVGRQRAQALRLTYGHRNVQGLAQRKDGTLWSVEHGSYRDDEVNRLRVGGDYGWHPVPGYNESVPMTDQSLPGKQIAARWSSGEPTLATSGATWVYGKKLGPTEGHPRRGGVEGQPGGLHEVRPRGSISSGPGRPRPCVELGRLRSVTLTPNHYLLLTTDNDGGDDAILRVSPR